MAILILAVMCLATGVHAVDWRTDIGYREWQAGDAFDANTGKALKLVVPRNGRAAGQIVLRAGRPLKSLAAASSVLKSETGSLANDQVTIGYLSNRSLIEPGKPAEGVKNIIHGKFVPDGDVLAAIYITVEADVDTKAGSYTGTIKVDSSDGSFEVPLTVEVIDYVVPARSDLDFWVSLGHSPTQLAYYYDVPHYGEKHWQYIEQSTRLLGRVGHHVTFIPVLWHANTGSGHQMISFRKQGDKLVPDFTRMRRYLKLVARHCGRQRMVVLGVWGRWMQPLHPNPRKRSKWAPGEAWVTLEESPGKFVPYNINRNKDQSKVYDYTQHEAFWKTVYEGAAKAISEELGVEAEKIVLGFADDRHPSDEVDAFWKRIAPRSPGWSAWTHAYGGPGPRPALFQIVDVRPPDALNEILVGAGSDRVGRDKDGAQRPVFLSACRDFQHGGSPAWLYLTLPTVTTGRQVRGHTVGFSRVGLDYWPGKTIVLEDGQKVTTDGYAGAGGNSDNRTRPGRVVRNYRGYLTTPGPTGAQPLLHYDALLEGIQLNQARLDVIEAIRAGKGDKQMLTRALELQLSKGLRLTKLRWNKDKHKSRELFEKTVRNNFGQDDLIAGFTGLYEAAKVAQTALNQHEAAIKSVHEETNRIGR